MRRVDVGTIAAVEGNHVRVGLKGSSSALEEDAIPAPWIHPACSRLTVGAKTRIRLTNENPRQPWPSAAQASEQPVMELPVLMA